jgi:hypothetical protein
MNHLRTGNGKYHQGRGGTFVARRGKGELHACFIPGCECRIALHLLMCPTHWAMVPKPLQEQVSVAWAEYSAWPGDESARRAYSEARMAASKAVREVVL